MEQGTGKKVFVGLSGGVDSSVAAARLIDAGYDVTGVFIKVWHPEWMVCNWEQERLDAMRVAAHLDIPFLTCDAVNTYRDDVANYFIESYKAGKTPNPDVLCNQYVKFGRFLEFAKERGADFVATGHYARKVTETAPAELFADGLGESGRFFPVECVGVVGEANSSAGAVNRLCRGVDSNKDQTYFLWSLSNEQLKFALFPVGDTPKEEIRKEAEAQGIPVATKKDSQGICFLGHVDIAEFLSHYTELVPGDVLDSNGAVVGTHHGALVYTLGQRHGFDFTTVDSARVPHYVIAKDIERNTITVDATPPAISVNATVTLSDTVVRQPISIGDELQAQFRYRQKPFTVVVTGLSPLCLSVANTNEQPASGQSCVLYDGEVCLGGGIID